MNALTKVILITAFIFYYLPNLTLAQAPDTLWTRTYGGASDDVGFSVQQTADGGYIIVGNKGQDIFLIKTDENGDTLWTKLLGGYSWDSGRSVRQTADGGYIVTGITTIADEDVILIKTTFFFTMLLKN